MDVLNREQSARREDWQQVDARILGQILAAQNVLFVLPDEARIAEYFSQALSGVPGVLTCFVCLGDLPAPPGASSDICSDCATLRKKGGGSLVMPHTFSCALAERRDTRAIAVRTREHVFGYFVFRTDTGSVLEAYWPFLSNLASYVALSLENRMQRLLLEKARDELEARVRERTEELSTLNARIQKINQELEQRVAERTSELEETNKELEAFVYSASHDLRAPLRGIDGFCEVLLEDYGNKVDAQGKDYLQRVRAAAQRMDQLIDDMLGLSRVNRSEMTVQRVDLSEIAREIAAELHESQPERRVEFVIQEGIDARGDGRLLRIVMQNLLGNAWKFTSRHEAARIEFGLRHKDDTVIYYVRDDGAGFDMKYAKKLFGAFQRLHATTEFPGTGVGLATVQRIIHRHGGDVWGEGEAEKGATFSFTVSCGRP